MKQKQILLILALLCGIGMANAGQGSMSFFYDYSGGNLDNPDLDDFTTREVTGEFANGILTISNMPNYGMDINFEINMETGEVVAQGQMADEYMDTIYYYSDLATRENAVYGQIVNIEGKDESVLTLQPWGISYDWYGTFHWDYVYYHTNVSFDFSIPGLKHEVPLKPEITIEDVSYEIIGDSVDSLSAKFSVAVASRGIDEDSVIQLFYKDPWAWGYDVVAPDADGLYRFTIDYLSPNQTYSMSMYALCGSVLSHNKVVEFNTDQTGIDFVNIDHNEVRYFNLHGVEVKNPQNGVYVRVDNGKCEKVLKK